MHRQNETRVDVSCDVPDCAAADREPLPDLSGEWFARDPGVVAYRAGQIATIRLRHRGWYFCEPWESSIRGARDLCPTHNPLRQTTPVVTSPCRGER